MGDETPEPITEETDTENVSNLLNDEETFEGEINVENNVENSPRPKLTRKRLSKQENWKRNIRKRNHQAGKEYVNEKGKTVPEKVLKSTKDCMNICKYKCSKNIAENERLSLFNGFYDLAQNEKQIFIVNNTERVGKNRKTNLNQDFPPKRTFLFKYYFNIKGHRVQVCKSYFLITLQISQKPVYNAHSKKNVDTGIPKSDGRGLKKHTGAPENWNSK